MKISFKTWGIALIALMGVLYSCSDEDYQSLDDLSAEVDHKPALDFVAGLSPQQQENFDKTGNIFLPDQQKNSWTDVIDSDIPVTWGVFDSPFKTQTRAAGIWGSYPAQYWSMIRVKVNALSFRIKDAVNAAADKIEQETNVRFYNSQWDDEYYEPGHIKLPNVMIRYADANTEGSGSFGLVGGEQYINVPRELDNEALYDEDDLRAFFMHALCNAAGMFNEQMRKDRDSFVKVISSNIKSGCTIAFAKQNNNYTMYGTFDEHSITLAHSKAYSKNGGNTITNLANGQIARNKELSNGDKNFLNNFYLPYKIRTDVWIELDTPVYYNGRTLTDIEVLQLQTQLNQQRGLYGNPPYAKPTIREPW